MILSPKKLERKTPTTTAQYFFMSYRVGKILKSVKIVRIVRGVRHPQDPKIEGLLLVAKNIKYLTLKIFKNENAQNVCF